MKIYLGTIILCGREEVSFSDIFSFWWFSYIRFKLLFSIYCLFANVSSYLNKRIPLFSFFFRLSPCLLLSLYVFENDTFASVLKYFLRQHISNRDRLFHFQFAFLSTCVFLGIRTWLLLLQQNAWKYSNWYRLCNAQLRNITRWSCLTTRFIVLLF